jgi:6-pyruvoyltetrahydropterin/6-carboxytetrahydropterin synthase
VLEKIDHTNLNDMPVFSDDPSAERIAQYIFIRIEEELPKYLVDPKLLWAVDAYETPLTMARYER